jgi:hypothetical protein
MHSKRIQGEPQVVIPQLTLVDKSDGLSQRRVVEFPQS